MAEREVSIQLDGGALPGSLGLPQGAKGLVIFAHGSGSSRLSPRNNYVARELRQGGVGTLLFDLLTPEEDVEYMRRFDIGLLAQRLMQTTHWVQNQSWAGELAIGYFGASTGSAAALYAAAEMGAAVRAVVSRGGRPDLAMDVLARVQAPTLLIVGGADEGVIELNQQAYDRLQTTKHLSVIPGATHLFEEPGTLEEVARLATRWFQQYLGEAKMERVEAA